MHHHTKRAAQPCSPYILKEGLAHMCLRIRPPPDKLGSQCVCCCAESGTASVNVSIHVVVQLRPQLCGSTFCNQQRNSTTPPPPDKTSAKHAYQEAGRPDRLPCALLQASLLLAFIVTKYIHTSQASRQAAAAGFSGAKEAQPAHLPDNRLPELALRHCL